MADDDWRSEYLERLATQDARMAFNAMKEAETLGLVATPNTGAVKAVRLHDKAGEYLFSYIINRSGLLFYVRKPAMKEYPGIGTDFSRRFDTARQNPAGEWTLQITSGSQASDVIAWLRHAYGR